MSYSILYFRFQVLSTIQEFRFPPHPTRPEDRGSCQRTPQTQTFPGSLVGVNSVLGMNLCISAYGLFMKNRAYLLIAHRCFNHVLFHSRIAYERTNERTNELFTECEERLI